MARKLHFFKEQMSKAGLSPSAKIMMRGDIDMDDLEVYQEIYPLIKNIICCMLTLCMHMLGKTWRA